MLACLHHTKFVSVLTRNIGCVLLFDSWKSPLVINENVFQQKHDSKCSLKIITSSWAISSAPVTSLVCLKKSFLKTKRHSWRQGEEPFLLLSTSVHHVILYIETIFPIHLALRPFHWALSKMDCVIIFNEQCKNEFIVMKLFFFFTFLFPLTLSFWLKLEGNCTFHQSLIAQTHSHWIST